MPFERLGLIRLITAAIPGRISWKDPLPTSKYVDWLTQETQKNCYIAVTARRAQTVILRTRFET
jgi:hypothetical protein